MPVEMLAAHDLDVLWVVGANPLGRQRSSRRQGAFVVVQDMFLTETAQARRCRAAGGDARTRRRARSPTCTGEVQRLKCGARR